MALLLYRLLFPFAFVAALPFYALRLLRRDRGYQSLNCESGFTRRSSAWVWVLLRSPPFNRVPSQLNGMLFPSIFWVARVPFW